MRKLILIVALFLSGCSYFNAPKFDVNENLLVAIIKKTAVSATSECDASPSNAVMNNGPKLLDVSKTYEIYSENLLDNQDSHKMAVSIVDMTNNLMENSKTMSATYCKEKFTNITNAADKVLKALALKARN